MNPTGGLPRRKSALAQITLKGPVLVFDAGNALFAVEGKADEALKPRAQFILETMARLGTKVMAAGAKDLGAGGSWLKQAAAKAGLKVLSANLKENGERLFDGSTVVTADGTRFGFIGLSAPGETEGSTPMVAEPLIPAVKAELAKLKGQADFVILLAAVRQVDAFELAKEFAGQIDFIVKSGEAVGMIPAQNINGTWVVGGGAKGQALAQVALKLNGKGPLIDLSAVAREKELLASLELKIKQFEPRVKAAQDPKSKELMKQTLAELVARRKEQKKKVDPGVSRNARTFDFTYVMLNASVVDEPELKAKVLEYEPTYAGAH